MDTAPAVLNSPGLAGASPFGAVPIPSHSMAALRQPARDSAHAKGLNPNDARTALDAMLSEMVRAGGSDLHVTVGRPPMARIHGDLSALPGWETLTPADTEAIVRCVVSDEQWTTFERDLEYDLAYSLAGRLAVPDQPLPAAQLLRLGHARHPARDQAAARAGHP